MVSDRVKYLFLVLGGVTLGLMGYLWGWVVMPPYTLGVVVGVVVGINSANNRFRREVAAIIAEYELRTEDF